MQLKEKTLRSLRKSSRTLRLNTQDTDYSNFHRLKIKQTLRSLRTTLRSLRKSLRTLRLNFKDKEPFRQNPTTP